MVETGPKSPETFGGADPLFSAVQRRLLYSKALVFTVKYLSWSLSLPGTCGQIMVISENERFRDCLSDVESSEIRRSYVFACILP